MPPAQATSTVPSQLLAAAVMAFRSLVATIQGTEDQGNQLNQVVNSLGDMATMFERVATSTAAFEQQFNQQANTNSQVQQLQQQVNQQATINGQLNSEVNNLKQMVQATSQPANQNTGRKPLCESRSVANLKTLGSKKEDFKNWNERLINSTTQVFGPEWRKFLKH